MLPLEVVTPVPATGFFTLAWLLIAIPAASSAVLLLVGRRADRWAPYLGAAAPLACFAIGLVYFVQLLGRDVPERAVSVPLYNWISSGRWQIDVGLLIDQLSIVFALLITGVGGLIHVYSIGYMAHDARRRRFFAFLNLFVAAMLLLVLADNYLVLFVGWEGVGLASYLLIGFWQYKPVAATEICPIQLVCSDATDLIAFRAPIVTSIAPDQEDCNDPSGPGGTEDVQITGFCFFGDIQSAFLATNPDGTGTVVQLSNVIHVVTNEITATVPLAQLTPDTPYYVFVVRGDGVRSTSYPNPLGFNVTFTCVEGDDPDPTPIITSCRLVRVSGGRFVLQVNGTGIVAGQAVLRLNGTACRRQTFPARFIGAGGLTTRINCSGGVKRLLPATLTITNPDGQTSAGFPCNF